MKSDPYILPHERLFKSVMFEGGLNSTEIRKLEYKKVPI